MDMEQFLTEENLLAAAADLGYAWAATDFLSRCLGKARIPKTAFASLLLGGLLLVHMAAIHCRFPPIAFPCLCHLLLIGLALLLFRGEWEKKLLAAALAFAATTLAGDFLGAALSFLSLLWLHAVQGLEAPILEGWALPLLDAAQYAVKIGILAWMARRLAPIFSGKIRTWYLLLALPLLALTAVANLAGWGASNGILLQSRGNMGIYYDQLFSYAGIGILAGLSLFAAGSYVFGMHRIYLEQQKNSQYSSQAAAYRMLLEQYRQTERLRHDMKNHILALSGLYEHKEWDNMGCYLEEIRDCGGISAPGEATGSLAVDALLCHKQRLAEDQGIAWECDVQIPKPCRAYAFDLCVLFGNLLDNALEACGQLPDSNCPFIHIQARAVKKCFLLEVKNSTAQIASHRHINSTANTASCEELFPGRPAVADGHGIGLQNVRDVADKHHGILETGIKNGVFTASLLMPLPEEKKPARKDAKEMEGWI